MRRFFDEKVKAEAKERELTHERPSKEINELMGSPEWNIRELVFFSLLETFR
jgi:hypothetical protein